MTSDESGLPVSATTGRLDGKSAVITGAANGIGRATAQVFATEGARLVVTDIDDDGEPGGDPIRGEHRDFPGDLAANLLRDGRSVEDPRRHRATPTARVSRMTVTLIWPGYCSSLSIRRAIDSANSAALVSSIRSGTTITRISRPA